MNFTYFDKILRSRHLGLILGAFYFSIDMSFEYHICNSGILTNLR